jgi:hypothetical protein
MAHLKVIAAGFVILIKSLREDDQGIPDEQMGYMFRQKIVKTLFAPLRQSILLKNKFEANHVLVNGYKCFHHTEVDCRYIQVY